MIDLHCHALPGVDDGPGTPEEAIALARGAQQDGITTIAATPHVDWAFEEIDSVHIRSWVDALQQLLNEASVDVRLVTGAEVDATKGLELSDSELQALTLGSGGWLLLECPLRAELAPGFVEIAHSLARRGHRLLLAHPERSPVFLRSPELLDQLVAEGMLAQVTAGSLSGRYGRDVRRLALGFVQRGAVQVVASDGHGGGRPARIAAELVDVGLDPALQDWLSRQVPEALLAGAAPPPRPESQAGSSRKRLRRLVRR